MASFTTTVLPLLLVVLTGFVAGAGKWLDITAARLLARFVFLFAMPVAVFNFYTKAPPPGLEVLPFMGAYGLAMILSMGISIFAAHRLLNLNIREAGAHGFVSICGNAVFLGLPVVLSVEGWGQPFLMLMIMEGIFVFGIATAVMSWPEKTTGDGRAIRQFITTLGKSVLLPLRNPIVVASLLGITTALMEVSYPTPLLTYLNLFGATAGPAGLFVLGLYMAILPKEGLRPALPNLALVSLIKLIVFPALTGALIWWVTKDWTLTGAGVLFSAMPPAVSSIVQASHYQLYERQTVLSVVVGTVLGLGALVAVLAVFA